MSLRSAPSLGSILLLILGVAILLASGDEDERERGERDRKRERAERPERSGPGERPERPGHAEPAAPGIPASLVAVVDGDTARMLVRGREESVRYIGVDTPESVIPGERPECFGERAAALNRSLVEGVRLRLVIGVERRDHYGRLLAYVYAGGRFVNAELVRRGFARTLAISPNTRFAERFSRLQQAAANAGRGLWSAC